MNEANGGTIKYHFKADDSDLQNKLNGVKKALSTTGKVLGGVTTAVGVASTLIGGALVSLSKQSMDAYGEVEQSIGGIETLFGDSASKVIENAKKAYKTAGVDANTYMQGVASFSASLLQATGNNAEKTAEISDMAFKDMSDNANTFGTDMQSITKAYQGFARGQFNMLDNLKLGYSGTKAEMERLLADAERISGIHYDISNLADIYNAIHVIQGELKITGTTSREAMNTLSGSINSAKMAVRNLLSGQGTIDAVVETVTQAGINISKNLVQILPNIVEGIVGIINGLMPMLPGLIETLLPVLIEGTVNLIQGLVQSVPTLLNVLLPLIPDIAETLIKAFGDILTILGEAMPTLVPVIVESLVDAIISLVENADALIEGAVALIVGLTEGVLNALPILTEKAPYLISALAKALLDAMPILLQAAWKLGLEIPKGLYMAFDSAVNVGKQLAKGLWNGLANMKQWVIDKVKGFGKSILKSLKNVLGIASPSKEFAWVGKMSILGYTEAIDDMRGEIDDAIQETFSLSPQLMNSASLHYSPNVIVNNEMNMTTDPLGQVVGNIKTFANGSKNDYNYGMGV